MLYVSFVEIYSNKSNAAFVEAGYSDVEAYRYSTLTFFAGFLVVFLLDQLVHLIIHWSSKKSAEDGCACDEQVDRMTSTTSRAVLLEQEDVSRSGVKRDDMMEAGAAPKSVIMSDQPEDAPEGPEVDSDEGDDEDADADDKKKRKKEERYEMLSRRWSHVLSCSFADFFARIDSRSLLARLLFDQVVTPTAGRDGADS